MNITAATLLVTLLAQISLPLPKLPIPVPGLPQTIPIPPILRDPPPVTTTVADGLSQVPDLDDFTPAQTASLSWLPRDANGAFELSPGAYAWTVQSYCLNVGAHAPGSDAAYVLAPLRGSLASVVADIVDRSAAHPEIAQNSVQLLLWTITSRGRIADTNGAVRAAADVLMTSAERRAVDGGVLGAIPPAVRDAFLAGAPPDVRQAFDTVTQVRDLLTNGNASYEQIERIAAPVANARNGTVPRSRWAFAPAGYFLRLQSDGYHRMRIEVYVPEGWRINRDATGRIASVAAANGHRINITYMGARAQIQAVTPRVAADHAVFSRAKTTLAVSWTARGDDVALRGLQTAIATSPVTVGWSDAQRISATDALARARADLVYRGLTHTASLAARQIAFVAPSVAINATSSGPTFSPNGVIGAPSDAGLQPIALSVRDGDSGVVPTTTPTHCDHSGSAIDPIPVDCLPRTADKNPTCTAAREELLFDENARELYANPIYREEANNNHMTGTEYEALILGVMNGDTGGGDGSSSTPVETGADTSPFTCETRFFPGFYTEPAPIQQSIRAHEAVHKKTCESIPQAKRVAADTPDAASADEVAAYTAGIAVLLRWIAANCP